MSQPLVRDYYALSCTSGGYQRSNLLGGFLYLSGYLRTQGCLVSLVALACTTGDDGVRCTGDDGVRCTGDDGVCCTGDDGVRCTGDDGVRYTGDDGVCCTGDDGVRCTGDDGVRCTGDDGVTRIFCSS